MARVLITGGFGFVGSALARRCFALGHDVTLLSRSLTKLQNVKSLPCRSIIKDVRQIGQRDIEGQDWLFHCASTVDNYNLLSDPFIDTETNCLGTVNLLDVCRKFNPDIRIVYPSTFFVNGNLPTLPATPDSPCNPLGLYGATKLAAEHFCRTYHTVFGMHVVIARLVNIFGVGEQRENNKKAAFNRMIHLAVQDKTLSVYGEHCRRDILYIDDAVEGLLTLIERGTAGQTYYVGAGVGVKIGAFAETVIEEAKRGRITYIDPPQFHLDTGIQDFWCDPGPLQSLGWMWNVRIREGIRRVIQSYEGQDG